MHATGNAITLLLETLLNIKRERRIVYEIESMTVKVVDDDDRVREVSALVCVVENKRGM